MLRRYFCPDDYLKSFREATPEFLAERGIKGIILDIDNTLAPYEMPDPDEEILAWFASLESAGIRAAFVSNNHGDRVTRFNLPIGIPAFPDGKKPLRVGTRKALEAMGVSPEEAAIMGDQVFTDVWAGRRIGVRTILVPPIRDKRDIFTKSKRLLEKPILRYYAKKKKKDAASNE